MYPKYKGCSKSISKLESMNNNNVVLTFFCSKTCSASPFSLIAQLVKNLPAIQETPVRFLGREDSLEKG